MVATQGSELLLFVNFKSTTERMSVFSLFKCYFELIINFLKYFRRVVGSPLRVVCKSTNLIGVIIIKSLKSGELFYAF